MAIDASIPLQAQGINVAKMIDDGSQIGQIWQQQRLNKELDRIYNESQGDVDKMLQLGQRSQMARYVVPQIQAQQAASQKNLLDQQKTLAEIANTTAQANEHTANAGNTTFDTSQKKFGAIQGVFQQAAMTGDKGQVLLGLDAFQRAGGITSDEYAHQFSLIQAMTPKEVKNYARGIAFTDKNTAPLLYQSANNAADNQTAIANNIRITDTTKRGQDFAARTAANSLAQDKIIKEQELALKRGEFETMTGTDGKAYAVYRNGQVEPLLLKTGEALTLQPKGTNKETQLQMIKRKESAQNHVSASAQAASGATLAANIANRYVQGGYNPAKFALESRIPGTEAYGIAKDLESLKSNAFLSRSDQMRGLGALTETEGARLISSVSPLDPMQSSEKFLSDLKNVAGTFSDIAKSNRDKAQLYANPNGNIANPTIAPAKNTEQNVTIPKGAYMTLSDVKASAMNAGISVEEAIQRLQSKGVTIR
ncbi:hypothetical protein NLHDIDDJ_02857 [Acinetobacter baumannii]|uniref:hypothetical protein n=1 Tax=Acinetobacter baumannii TaxID=470 RepID=UPI001E650179|nr:hypothetical protein [Acinetobacter baumannii]UDY21191.1 hypothetical protein NLHDIDDJ_02857 [Acinetobacter baumannii]